MKKAFITGITGMCGSHLAEILLNKGYKVSGLIRQSEVSTTERIDYLLKEVFLKTQKRGHSIAMV